MDRRSFVRTAALVPLAAGCAPLSFASTVGIDSAKREANIIGSTPLQDRYELTLRRVLDGHSPMYSEEFLLADVRPTAERRFTEYSGDLSGRYIGALATASRVYGTEFPGLDALVAKTIALQKADGYFGRTFHYDRPTDEDLALLWGNGRLLVGLIEYYGLKPSPKVLAACKRLGDWLVRIGPLMLSKEIREAFGAQHFASSYICWMQQTEGLAGLYVVTKDERYRKLAEEIAAVIERRPSDHVHGYLTSLRGVMDLYVATNDAQLLQKCETAWHEVASSKDLLITGGVPEGWSPNNHRTEGCGEADWVRFSLQLWGATGRWECLVAAERAIFNELAFNQFETGDFGHHVYTETGLPAAGAARAWWCCTLHGLRCFPDIHENAFSSKDEVIRYDFPLDGRIETPNFSAIAQSNLSKDGTVQLAIVRTRSDLAQLDVRKPDWAESIEFALNGNVRGSDFPVSLLRRRSSREAECYRMGSGLKAGDVITAKYNIRVVRRTAENARVNYTYGPWLLGASAADNPAYFNELTLENRIAAGKETTLSTEDGPSRRFTVPIAATSAPCVQAEFPDQPGTVVLRAIAEQTGMSTTSWELQFLQKEPS